MEKQDRDVPWWSPQAIAQQEAQVRALADEGRLDVRNDFASYRALADGMDPVSAGLHHHNPYEQAQVSALCRDYLNIWRKLRSAGPSTVADLGCGVGYTTAGLKRVWPNATVLGLDVSQDAVRFAMANWVGCQFEAKALDPGKDISSHQFDLLLCQEFYPFTRTESTDEHRSWLKFLVANLTPQGIAVVTVSTANQESVNSTYSEFRKEFEVNRYHLAAPRISRRVPFIISRVLGRMLRTVKPQWARTLYILRK